MYIVVFSILTIGKHIGMEVNIWRETMELYCIFMGKHKKQLLYLHKIFDRRPKDV